MTFKGRCATEPDSVDPPKICDLFDTYETLRSEWVRLNDAGSGRHYDLALARAQQNVRNLDENTPLLIYFEDYQFFVDFNYGIFMAMPHRVLVLSLSMAMGMLGGVVTITWNFIRNDSGLTIRRFIILPFIGSMSAFIVLIFLSAGQLKLTAGDADVSLNPFVLSFVGIISGLLSERVYARISDVGGNFFKVDDGSPRWGFRLQAALDAAGVTVTDLARHLEATEEETPRIMAETTTATLTQQRLIAAFLRLPVRELFTDISPEGPARAAAVAKTDAPDPTGRDPTEI